MKRPELIQFGSLGADHFNGCPVWMSCDSFDYEKEWFDETDEETFRPWTGSLPVSPANGMFLVRAAVTFRDGSAHRGFITPQVETKPLDLGIVQPRIFLPDGTAFGFWFGMLGCDASVRADFYRVLGKSPADVFPAHFAADPNLSSGRGSGEIAGFYSTTDLQSFQVQT